MASLREKLAYALGDAAAGGITWKIMSIAFPFFFTNVFGLTLGDTAALMLIARLFDVVTDPILGSLADRTQSRWGTYRPWLIFGAIPFGLIFALLLGWSGATMVEDAFGNEIIDPLSVTESVKTMIWAIFSLIPALIAFLMAFLAYIYPIKK